MLTFERKGNRGREKATVICKPAATPAYYSCTVRPASLEAGTGNIYPEIILTTDLGTHLSDLLLPSSCLPYAAIGSKLILASRGPEISNEVTD